MSQLYSKGPVELSNLNTCAKAKLRLFLFTSDIEIVCRQIEVLMQLILTKYK